MNIEQTTFPTTTFLGIKQTVSFAAMKESTFFEENFNTIFVFAGLQAIELTGQPATMYFTWDEDKEETTLALGIPVSNDIASIDANNDSIEVIKIDESKAIKAEHWGDYMKLGDTHKALTTYCKENDIDLEKSGGPCIEHYVTDPGQEPDQSKWLTNVYYLIK